MRSKLVKIKRSILVNFILTLSINKGIALNQFEVYQAILDKGFTVKAIASIFSVSEELIKKFLIYV